MSVGRLDVFMFGTRIFDLDDARALDELYAREDPETDRLFLTRWSASDEAIGRVQIVESAAGTYYIGKILDCSDHEDLGLVREAAVSIPQLRMAADELAGNPLWNRYTSPSTVPYVMAITLWS